MAGSECVQLDGGPHCHVAAAAAAAAAGSRRDAQQAKVGNTNKVELSDRLRFSGSEAFRVDIKPPRSHFVEGEPLANTCKLDSGQRHELI